MIQEKILFQSKDGREIEIRTPRGDEAQTSLEAMIEISEYSPYILTTPETFRQKSLENQVKWIEDSIACPSSILIAQNS